MPWWCAVVFFFPGDYNVSTFIMAGSGAGAVAAAATTPLDLIKTRLQTQVSK